MVINMKKFSKLLGTALLIAALTALPAAAYERIPISLNGVDTSLDARLIGTTTYVSLTEASALLGEATGADPKVRAIPEEMCVTARGRYIGGSENLDIDGEVFVPIRSVAKAYCASVDWQEATRSVELRASENDGIVPGDEYYIADEVEWLSRIIYAEAGIEPFAGKILVGNVVLNRVRSSEFPDTIYDVIFDRKYGVQFTPTVNGMIWRTPSAACIAAAKICLDNFSLSDEALYFLDPDIATNFWIPQNRPFLMKVGGHEFYG